MTALPFTEFTADGFRGLRSLEVKDLRGINVFVGGNNSGKTSILESLSLMARPASGLEWVRMVGRRDYGGLDESIVSSLRWCFAHADPLKDPVTDRDGGALTCSFSSNGSHLIRQMRCQFSEFMGLPRPKEDPVAEALDDDSDMPVPHGRVVTDLQWASESTDLPKSVTLTVDESGRNIGTSYSPEKPGERAACPQAALLPYSYQLNSRQVLARSSQLFLDDDALLIDLMRQFDEDVLKVEVASFTGKRPAIYIKHRQLGVVPLSAFGDAMRRCLLLASTLTSLGAGGVLLLDEIEVGIHVESLPKVFRWLTNAARRTGVQVFATTHSLEVLDALLAAEVAEKDLAAYQIKQGEDRTGCRRFSFDSLKRLRYERGLDVR